MVPYAGRRRTIGRPVDPTAWLAIYNEKAGEFLIQFDRTAGADIGWPSSKTWGEQLSDRLLQEAKEQAYKLLIEAATA